MWMWVYDGVPLNALFFPYLPVDYSKMCDTQRILPLLSKSNDAAMEEEDTRKLVPTWDSATVYQPARLEGRKTFLCATTQALDDSGSSSS